MAEPTLKDVLNAIAEMRSEMATKRELDAVRSELKSDIRTVEAKVDAHRAETAKGFAELDRELSKHADVHRKIEEDITSLKGRPARTAARSARPPRAR